MIRINPRLCACALACAVAFVVPVRGASAASSTSPPSTLLGLQQDFEKLVRHTEPEVVQIKTGAGLGSGIVFNTAGDIVTNDHVVAGATQYKVTLADGKKYAATLVGTFAPDDLAVLKISGATLNAATFANSSDVEVGDIVLALGNPLGLRSSATEGIVSAVGRTVDEGNGIALPDVIQTSAPINPGNSGGALVSVSGKVVGIPTLAAVDPELGTTAPGIGFAIPSDVVKSIAGQIIKYGHVVNSQRAYLGVRLAVSSPGSTGAVVAAVTAGGPAATAGVKAGDQILAIDGDSISSGDDVATALARLVPGRTVSIKVKHSGDATATLSVVLGQYPGTPPAG
jgi:putative serine protease PepD